MNQLPTIPIVDIGSYIEGKQEEGFAANLREICKRIGFFYIQNHKVPLELQEKLVEDTRKFFSLPEEEKNKIHMKKGGRAWRGYSKLGQELTSGKKDLKQGLYLGQELDQTHPKVINKVPLHGRNLFPEEPATLKENVLSWQKQMAQLGHYVLSAIAESLGLHKDYFKNTICKNHMGLLRLFHYPADDNSDPTSWAVGEHTDYGLITLLLITQKGLQVKNKQDQWINIDPIPKTFVVNIADILERITNGLYKSTPHRAKNRQGVSRYSIPYFFDPDWDAQIKVIDFQVSEEDKQVQKATNEYKRWDQKDLSYLTGIYGTYLSGKLSKIFPELASQTL